MGLVFYTALQLADASPKMLRLLSVVIERTVAELNGESCLALEDVANQKRNCQLPAPLVSASPTLRTCSRQGAGHRGQGTGHRAQSTGLRAQWARVATITAFIV